MSNNLVTPLRAMTFGGFDCQASDLSIHLDLVSGLNDGLEVRGDDTVVPGLAGRVARDRKRDVRHLVLAGIIQGTGSTESARQASYQNLCDALEAAFPLDDDPATLTGTARDSTTRSIDARTTNIVWDDEPVRGTSHVTILLDSVDPDWSVS